MSSLREDGQRESDRVIRDVERQINGGQSVSPPFRWKPRRWPYLEAWLAAHGRADIEEQPEPVSRIVSRETITGQRPITQKTAEG
jgi:hypothetical protein